MPIERASAFRIHIEKVAFLQPSNGLFERADIAGALPHGKRVEHRSQEPCAEWVLEQFCFRDVIQRPMQAHREKNRIKVSLMIGDNQHAAAARDVVPAVDL